MERGIEFILRRTTLTLHSNLNFHLTILHTNLKILLNLLWNLKFRFHCHILINSTKNETRQKFSISFSLRLPTHCDVSIYPAKKKRKEKNFALNRNVAAVFRNAQRGLRDQLEQTVSFHKTSQSILPRKEEEKKTLCLYPALHIVDARLSTKKIRSQLLIFMAKPTRFEVIFASDSSVFSRDNLIIDAIFHFDSSGRLKKEGNLQGMG